MGEEVDIWSSTALGGFRGMIRGLIGKADPRGRIDGGCRLIFSHDLPGQSGEDLLDIRAIQGRSLQEGHAMLVCQLLALLFRDSPAALKIRLGTHQ